MYGGVAVVWVLILCFTIMGIKSIRIGTLIVIPFTFLSLFICLGHYVGLHNSVNGKGFKYYLQGGDLEDPFPFPRPYQTPEQLFKDAYTQVFYSMGLCMGIHYAYGSYNHIKKPVIADSFVISFIGFLFSFIVGFMAWGAIGYLNAKEDPDQRQTSSIGLTYIAMAKVASMNGSVGMYVFFLFFMFCTGITQVYAMVLSFVTNVTDYFKCKPWKVVIPVCIVGIIVTLAYTSNAGFILFDLTEHFILRYIVIMVGFLQCVAVGWFFEYFTTAAVSPLHAKSLRLLSLGYWFPVVVITFYANFALEEGKILGLVVISVTTMMSLVVSFCVAKMDFDSWYHEIVLQGVDKLSMSITSLSNPKGKRSMWMLPFETYFGICIKYINPACLLFIFFNNLQEDIAEPYNDQTRRMYMFATIPVVAAGLVIIIPIFTCGNPEVFRHDVNR
jgi:SNF family Na+-dependent transporter